jgi:hypothetical protein
MKTDSKCFNDKLGWVKSTNFIITNYVQINHFPTIATFMKQIIIQETTIAQTRYYEVNNACSNYYITKLFRTDKLVAKKRGWGRGSKIKLPESNDEEHPINLWGSPYQRRPSMNLDSKQFFLKNSFLSNLEPYCFCGLLKSHEIKQNELFSEKGVLTE